MAKKPKNKKSPNVTVNAVQDVSEKNLEPVTIPYPAKGPAEPTPGLLPDDSDTISPSDAFDEMRAEFGGITDEIPLAGHVGEMWKSVMGDDVPPPGEVIVSTPTSAVDYTEQAMDEQFRQTAKKKVADFIISIDPGTADIAVSQLVSQPKERTAGDYSLEWVPDQPLVGHFKTEALQGILPKDAGFNPGKLYLFAFNTSQYRVTDVSAWLDRSIEWDEGVDPVIYFYNHATERAMVRQHREDCVKNGKVAIGIVATPPHVFQIDPPHIPHSMECDVAFSIDALKITRRKFRGRDTIDFPSASASFI